jgi:poly(hydroxyalkanoate) depolymerase family esterase
LCIAATIPAVVRLNLQPKNKPGVSQMARRLGRTLADLSRYRRVFDAAVARPRPQPAAAPETRLREVAAFGANPGNLRLFEYVPATVAEAPALVVVLHGCTQTAAGYDHGAGWTELADRHGFVLLFPEQKPENNPKGCFNWYDPADTRRDGGEAASIRQTIGHATAVHGIDRQRVFVTGLSAGGAMAGAMLATYPEVFAAGAIVAGLPYGTAANVQEAFESMFKGRRWPAHRWGGLVRAASPHEGPWPRISVWHGSADATVVPLNADEIVKQWTDVHGLTTAPSERLSGAGFDRAVWRDRDGRVMVESVSIPGMAHGTPLATGAGEACCGNAGPFLLDVGVSSSHHIAQFFGLTEARAPSREKAERYIAAAAAAPAGAFTPGPEDILMPGESEAEPERDEPAGRPRLPVDVHAVITKALKAAGLIRT